MGEFANFVKEREVLAEGIISGLRQAFGSGTTNPRERDPIYQKLLQHFGGDRQQADGTYDELMRTPAGRHKLMRLAHPIVSPSLERPEDRWDAQTVYAYKRPWERFMK